MRYKSDAVILRIYKYDEKYVFHLGI